MSAVAIVGMSCRFAGAPDLQSFWSLVREGRHAFGPVPADRWDAAMFQSTSARDMDRTTSPIGGFLDDVRSFPALALGIPPRRVEVMDPQQRMTIETALEAIEDAGYRVADLPKRTGVYVGLTGHEFRILQASRMVAMMMASGQLGTAPEDAASLLDAVERVLPPRPFSAPGVLGNMAAAAVAQELDLRGPAYTVDAACSSSLVALHDAVAQLRTGQIDSALVGGAYLQLTPEHYIAFSRIGAMSTSGACRPFDHRADGFIQGDGVAMLLVKRLEDAQRDGDRIYAVIEGVAINNDGRGDGPMAPNLEGQSDVVMRAWNDAKTSPSKATHIETHGTGTAVGDVTEFEGLVASLQGAERVAIGSSKANIGHTMSTAGVAGLIKAALSIHHATLPPLGGFEHAKEDLPVAGTPFWFPLVPSAWDDAERWTGVSSFGFGGTNGHAVLRAPTAATATASQPELVTLSAPTTLALRSLAARTASAVRDDASITVAGVARAWARRRPQPARAAIVAASRDELLAALDALGAGTALPANVFSGEAVDGAPKVAFLFPGQGAQRVGMLRDLATRFPVVAASLARLEQGLLGETTVPLTHLIWPERRATPVDAAQADAELTATEHCQPVMLAAGVALTELLASLGVTPAVVTGHSLGEFTAAAVGGVLTAEDAARFVARRGKAMASLPGDHGAMAAVMAERQVVEGLLVDGATIANVNHPRQLVVSGRTEAVDAVVAKAEAAGVRAKRLDVSHAFHSAVLAAINVGPLVDEIAFAAPKVPVASGIAERPYAGVEDARSVFLRHATSPVIFTGALAQCAELGADLFLQVGAGGPLASFARGSVPAGTRGVFTLAPLDDADGGVGLLATLGQLWIAGVPLDVRAITAASKVASVPPSVLPRETYWVVQDKPTRRVSLGERTHTRRAAHVADEPVVVEAAAPPAEAVDAELEGVLAVVAKVSAYPLASLKPTMRLTEDLGFDSLMVGDLATQLAERFPGMGGIPRELLVNSPTVNDLVEFVKTGTVAGPDEDDDAALHRYAPTWRPANLPELPTRPVPTGPVLVVADDPAAREALAHSLREQGLDAQATDAAWAAERDAHAIIWVGPQTPPASFHAVVREDRAWRDQAGELLAIVSAHAKRGAKPHVLALSRHDDPWAAGVAGALRALSREWPSATVKHLTTDDVGRVSVHLIDELISADRSVDVRWTGGARHVPGLERVDMPGAGVGITAADVVLVTGGTRGLGLRAALRAASLGATVILVGRGVPSSEDQATIDAFERVRVVRVDVMDRDAVLRALSRSGITQIVHAAGMLADGAVDAVPAELGALARKVKIDGLAHVVAAAGSTLRRVVGLGSWAGRLGNRHQTHYAAANALLASLITHLPHGVHGAVGEYGPWVGSGMETTIPETIKTAMRAEGVDFVGPQAGMDALFDDLAGPSGAWVRGRRLPDRLRRVVAPVLVSLEGHPYLRDHTIDGKPILPLASVADLLAWAADRAVPYELHDLTLYAGVVADQPRELILTVDGDRAELRSAKGRLHDAAKLFPYDASRPVPEPTVGGDAPELTLEAFYSGLTFHGPMLQGIRSIDAVGPDFVRGTVVAGSPAEWIPGTERTRWAIDPLAFDSAQQLAAYAAYVRFRRAGTPVSMGRVAVLGTLTPGQTYTAEARFGEAKGDRFSMTIVLRDATGAPLLIAEEVHAEMKKLDGDDAPFVPRAQDTDFTKWQEIQDLDIRLDGLKMMGLQNPYFHVHEGTARDTTSVAGRELVNFSSYNYLGLSGDPRVLTRVEEAIHRYGTSVSASRVASGERPFHHDLEARIAKCQGVDDAILFTAGHATNVTAIGHLMGKEDLILHDAYIHDSALQGIKLSGAQRRAFAHEDPDDLERQLKALRGHYRRCLILVEGVYSMDGDLCALPRYIALKKRFGALLMVDEAHSFGIVGKTGCGIGEHWGIDGRDVDLWMGTLSKSMSSCGGWIAGSSALVRYLKYTSPGFVYSAGLTPANGVAALASLELMLEEPWRVKKLQDNAAFFHAACLKHGLDNGPATGGSGVVPVITGNSLHALVLSQRLQTAGINVQPIVYPAVPDDAARLRFFLSSTHSEAQLAWTADTVAKTLGEIRIEFPMP